VLKRSFLFNVFLVICLVAGLLFLFFNSLDWLTNHGKQTTVPKLVGKNMKEAVKTLERQGFKVQIDSTFVSYKNPLEVLFQEPEQGATVKIGRTIFLTINRKTPPSIKMPNLVNMSFRNAMLEMQSYRLVMGDTIYRPDVAAGSILEQWYKGKPIAAGTLVPLGSKISLVVGEGLYGEVDVPNLIGMSWNEAQNLIKSLELTSNVMWEGVIEDSATAVVFMQQPEALNELDFINKIPKGDLLDIRVMQSPPQQLLLKNQPGSKKLLGEYNEAIDSTNNILRADSIKKAQMNKNEKIGTTQIPTKSTNPANPNKKSPDKNQEPIKKTTSDTETEFE
jgi:beta-lactam-binding protein with PASTA domain